MFDGFVLYVCLMLLCFGLCFVMSLLFWCLMRFAVSCIVDVLLGGMCPFV